MRDAMMMPTIAIHLQAVFPIHLSHPVNAENDDRVSIEPIQVGCIYLQLAVSLTSPIKLRADKTLYGQKSKLRGILSSATNILTKWNEW